MQSVTPNSGLCKGIRRRCCPQRPTQLLRKAVQWSRNTRTEVLIRDLKNLDMDDYITPTRVVASSTHEMAHVGCRSRSAPSGQLMPPLPRSRECLALARPSSAHTTASRGTGRSDALHGVDTPPPRSGQTGPADFTSWRHKGQSGRSLTGPSSRQFLASLWISPRAGTELLARVRSAMALISVDDAASR